MEAQLTKWRVLAALELIPAVQEELVTAWTALDALMDPAGPDCPVSCTGETFEDIYDVRPVVAVQRGAAVAERLLAALR